MVVDADFESPTPKRPIAGPWPWPAHRPPPYEVEAAAAERTPMAAVLEVLIVVQRRWPIVLTTLGLALVLYTELSTHALYHSLLPTWPPYHALAARNRLALNGLCYALLAACLAALASALSSASPAASEDNAREISEDSFVAIPITELLEVEEDPGVKRALRDRYGEGRTMELLNRLNRS